MATITLKGNPIETSGELPAVGTQIAEFTLCSTGLADKTLSDFEGKLVLNIFPSIDTGICAMSVRAFNERAASLDGVTVLCISADLPFAHSRFCGAEGIENVESLSTFRNPTFETELGLEITTGPMAGLCSRVVIVVDADRKVVYTEQVPEIAQEPDYDAAIAALG